MYTYNLALMYPQGRGSAQDFGLALGLLESAATQDHAPSVYMMGVFRMQVCASWPVLQSPATLFDSIAPACGRSHIHLIS